MLRQPLHSIVKMQLPIFLLTILSVTSVNAVTCGWDGAMLKTDCLELLGNLAKGGAGELGPINYKGCHIRLSKTGVSVPRNLFVGALKQCLDSCNKFERIYCRYPNVPTSGGGSVDIVLGTHL